MLTIIYFPREGWRAEFDTAEAVPPAVMSCDRHRPGLNLCRGKTCLSVLQTSRHCGKFTVPAPQGGWNSPVLAISLESITSLDFILGGDRRGGVVPIVYLGDWTTNPSIHGSLWPKRKLDMGLIECPWPGVCQQLEWHSHFPWTASPRVSLFCQEKDKRRFFCVSLRRIPFSSKWIMLSLRRQINLSVISHVRCFPD